MTNLSNRPWPLLLLLRLLLLLLSLVVYRPLDDITQDKEQQPYGDGGGNNRSLSLQTQPPQPPPIPLPPPSPSSSSSSSSSKWHSYAKLVRIQNFLPSLAISLLGAWAGTSDIHTVVQPHVLLVGG